MTKKKSLLVVKSEKVREMEERKQAISIVELMQLMTHDSLLLYKKKGSRAPIGRLAADLNSPYRKGVVFVSPSKTDLTEGKGYVVTSYETLQEKHQQLTHWTPNTYRGGTYYDFKKRLIKGHTRDNLKQINVIGLDIDSNEADVYGLYLGCEEVGLPRPNLLLQTPRGFQVFFILDTPFYIHNKGDYKALRVAERLSQNIRQALSKYAPVDTNCVPFGFYRIPREDNVLDFSAELANTSQLLVWSKKYEAQHQKKLHVVYSENAPGVDYISSDWYQAIIRSQHIDKGHPSASRNNALFTLALANYASGRPFEVAYDELDQFNSNLHAPLSLREFEKTLKSAYSGKYQGVKREYVDGLLELWTEGNVKFQGKQGWYKFKKEREERRRSHYNEWEEDIISYIATHQSSENPYLQGSLSMLSDMLGIALSSLKEVLKRSRNLMTKTVGRGRKAYTMVTSRQLFIQHLLNSRKRNKQQALQEILETANPVLKDLEVSRVTITEDIPLLQLIPPHSVRNTS
ncbi:primase C-terminal domain-containing protein [Peribacillus asahii]|uniref:primase C-terminal domain-containing protein n=1 Tax=Peribacillus asahii TaxID=228899 RepID=UPI00207A049B|nr:primase C-terminal domain-containing protein [Peribacillus asahii]USK87492.1 primase C-terminal domain-containing protein [Peribacillus asahii]